MTENRFKALANDHRRQILIALLDHNPQDDRARIRAERDSESGDPDRLQTAMYHTHLPMLEDYGFIDWNEETNEISKGQRFEEVRPLLEFVADRNES